MVDVRVDFCSEAFTLREKSDSRDGGGPASRAIELVWCLFPPVLGTLYASYLIIIMHQPDSTTVSLVPIRCDGSQHRNGCWRMTSTMSDEAASRHVLLAVWRGDDNRFADELLYTCIIDGDKPA